MQPTMRPEDAAHLVCRAMEKRDDDAGNSLVNLFGAKPPEGMHVQRVAHHAFVAMRDLAYYAVNGHVRERD